MEFVYCWFVCIIINHIILYVYWRIKSKEGTTLGDMYLYHNKPGVILTYKLKGWVVSNNKTYKVYRDIFIVSIALLFAITIGSLIMSDYDSTFIHFAKSSAILFVTTIISYNLII